jgi:signal transduction histidine kinase
MSKRFVNPALSGSLGLLFLIWQLSVLAPCQSQVRPDMNSNVSRAQEASATGVACDLSRKNVLILHTFTYDTSAYLVMDPIFLKGFTDAGLDASNLYFEFLDLLRHRDQAHRRETTEHLRRKFTDQPIDLIIALHRTALSYLLEDGKGLFLGVPVINVIADPDWLREDFRTANEHRLQELKHPSVIMPLAIGTEPTIKNILTLLPETRALVVISGSDLLDRLTEQSVRRTLEAWHGRLQVEYLSGLPLEEVLERVSALAPKTAILYTVFGADTKGRAYRNYDVLRKINRAANAPIFGLYDTLLGNGGIVGGTMPTYSVEAARTVRLALEILRGRLPAEPVTILQAPTHPVFDWPELKRWGLNESALPADAIILNKPVSAWERYKLYIIGAVAFCVLETALIIFLIVQRRRKKVAEVEVARARTELLHIERSLRLNELTGSLAHELNQPLAAILSNAQAALRFLKSDKPDLNEFQEIMQDIISDDQRAGNVIRSLRSMMKREEREKKPVILDDVLNDIIQIYRSEAISRNVSIETELDGSLPPVFGDKGQLQQVVLNIIMNGAEAMSGTPPEQRKLILRTQRKDHSIWVTVRDFGPGIDKENLERVFQPFFTTKRTGLGMGLALCRTIVEAHGGHIWAENNSEGGTTFFIELPICESGN